jgi:hypothetical protein
MCRCLLKVSPLHVVIDGVEDLMQRLYGVDSKIWCPYGDSVVLCCSDVSEMIRKRFQEIDECNSEVVDLGRKAKYMV